ncbi:lipoprotein-releasing system ATP-binding protein [Chitinophaga niastensis]|uniref:Lipoprotein-releasing system ATP-binding protein n=1 Tax=Chitinophaga niastensis TaxID=536980 RepID=A0A2P8HDN4_CHINA|nr:ABC transporter ATP-binding protein [Chitinophaga niastensis]PSL44340.1 lipoprotein-releasing system ATP-binding protein [Chitinophaga niastensis]
MNNNIILEARHINKYFEQPAKFQVLHNIGFEVKQGEFLSIVGKSGSGKSTLLYILSTMDTAYEGELWIQGEKLSGKKKDQLAKFRNEHLGFVFQFHYLLPEFTALENVMLPALKLKKWSQEVIEQKAHEKLKLLDMDNYAGQLSSRLSGGQQQRVAIARALINEPAIIVADEPTGNLDTGNTSVVFGIFKALSRDFHQTIITVTHDETFAGNSDRIIEMSDGTIIHTQK